ncbi:Signal Transduction Histidine Kinases (STHK) [Paraburkholderia piptadeniae]|uniref:histidine kinase n=1 Tax=Paraburkholderia piptadeniae TaxID=1701573 RepID=A0A1N7S947_9BURK|nr:hybrid sensor histidine kinase/response regulator [Paraburkholderia piptadeniae]SIT43939.1 Signal Transduction Histidine Kinases (STHK) [Paraburkholderia piptadeniae]
MPRLSHPDAARDAQRPKTLATGKLDTRPHRAADYAAENEALHTLARALGASDEVMLQTLVDTALSLCGAGSAGISLRDRNATQGFAFRWVAVSGQCTAYVGHIIPSDDSSAGVALELDSPQLCAFPKRQFACLADIEPEITEELVVPVPGVPEPWGALWVMSHDEAHHFDNEHRRILTSLANFTCAALSIRQAKADAEARAAEAEAARRALAAAEANKDNFIATLGHELRGPLAPVDSALAAAQKLAADSPAVLSALAVANRQVGQLKRIVSDLLDASRIRTGKLGVRRAYGLLGDIIKDAVGTVREEAEKHQHRLQVEQPPYPLTVFADAGRLTQVFSNLLGNAVKYTPSGGEITLHVEAPDPGTIPEHDSTPREAVITILDSGMGIAADLLPHVFDLFTQAPDVRMRAEGGLGVGLSVVRYLVNAHQGEIAIASDGEGKGTEVIVRLPIVCRSHVAHAASTSHGMPPARILLVDDIPDATEALAILLALDGHEVKRAQSGPEALSLVESFTPDVALIDVNMPGMDGHELARLLKQRAQCASTRLVALTGYAGTTSERRADEFDCYLVKPPSLEDLGEVLRR